MSNVIFSGLPTFAENGSGGDFELNEVTNLTIQDKPAHRTEAPWDTWSSPAYVRMGSPNTTIPSGVTVVGLGFELEHHSGDDVEWEGFAWPKDYDGGKWSDITDNHDSLSGSTVPMDANDWTLYSTLIEIGGSGYNLSISPSSLISLWNNGNMGLAIKIKRVFVGGSFSDYIAEIRNIQLKIEYEEPVTRRRVLLTQIL